MKEGRCDQCWPKKRFMVCRLLCCKRTEDYFPSKFGTAVVEPTAIQLLNPVEPTLSVIHEIHIA